jgi:hypothetical protein
MAECKPAASSTTPVSSCERIISEFMAQGAPASSQNVSEGEVLGGFEIKTPKVGDGFVEWAIRGYDLEGKAPAAVTKPNYDKHGDWAYDKASIAVDHPASEDQINDNAYLRKGK